MTSTDQNQIGPRWQTSGLALALKPQYMLTVTRQKLSDTSTGTVIVPRLTITIKRFFCLFVFCSQNC